MKAKKVALVHDWLTGMRGGEKVLEAALELFPQAEIYTLIHRADRVSDLINSRRIHVSWLNSLPGVSHYYRYLLPLMPWAIESFDLGDYDLVLSFNHCVAKGVRLTPRPGRRPPLHICYCHTPMRYVYDQFHDYFADGSRGWMRFGAGLLRPALMRWDKKTSRGVDAFVANSENVRQRIRKAYGRDAAVIYPTVDTEFFRPLPTPRSGAPYYLIAGALVPYKRVDLAIAACRKLGVALKVVGVGTEAGRLKERAAGASVEFMGWQSDEALRELYQNCEASLFPADEDFGITAVEAMACGRPVIAYKKGGALETVREGVTGVFFEAQTATALADAIRRSKDMSFDPAAIRAHALRFDDKQFKDSFVGFVRDVWDKHAAAAKVRVMQVIECGGPGGTGYQVAAICNGLDPARFESSLVYAVRPGSMPREYEATAAGAAHFFHVPEMVREIAPLSDLRALWRLYRLFRQERPDIVHAHSSKAGFLARVAAWAAGVERIYYSPRGYSFLQTDNSAFVQWAYRLLERFASLFGTVVAVSESEAVLARGLGASGVRVVRDAYLGEAVGPSPTKSGRGTSSPYGSVVCASGRLSFARHPEAFVRLAQRLTDARNGVKCVWIGGGELLPVMEEMIRDLGLTGKLEVTGWLPHREALRRLADSDVLVHYSRWDAIPNAVIEAMACGLPVVASDIPGNRGLIAPGENGLLAATEIEFLEKTLQLIDDPKLAARLGAKGRAVVKAEYSRQRLLGELSELYGWA
ncbi:MAG: hypothetical protein A2V88_07175 [Elusimicrobia bacterium RBG_16_66_12]|nr:MAG: hypothetical protein A2V88_07175 [Elusimicrobia bacterium RBG_16_66_12]